MANRRASCRGVIFQFNPDAILFEFNDGDDDAIGVVKPHNVIVTASGRRIPFSAKTTTEIARFIHIGDEIECSVTKNTDLKKFIYTEDEEEVLENGEVKKSSHEVAIQPEWFANDARVVGRSKGEDFDNDEIGEIEGQLDDFFDDEIQVIREVAKPCPPKPPQISKPKMSPAKPASKTETPKNSVKITPITFSSKTEDEEHKSPDPKQEPLYTAKVLQLKRNANRSYREKTKVVTGYMQIIDGKYSGSQLTFSNHNLYIWGHHLNLADLLYHIKAGDEFQVEVTESSSTSKVTLKRGFMGEQTTEKMDPAKSKEFANWLASRSLDFAAFKKWTSDKLSRKAFFPLAGERMDGELVGMFREQTNPMQVVGVLKITSGPLEGKFVVFDSEDFYLFEVHIGNADMRLFLRQGDKLFCQVQDLSSSEKKRFKKIISDNFDFNHVAHIVHMGSTRPRSATMKPYESPELKKFLESLGRSLEEFEQMKTSKKTSEEKQKEEQQSKPEIILPLIQQQYPVYSITQTPGISNTVMASTLTAKAMMLSSLDDPLIQDLFQSHEDVQNAAYLAKVFTHALLLKMQSHMRSQIQIELGHNSQAALEAQAMQIAAAENSLLQGQRRDPVSNAVQEHMEKKLQQQQQEEQKQQRSVFNARSFDSSKAIVMTKKLEEVEAKLKEEELAKQQLSKAKKKEDSSKKIKKMFESFKASKNPRNNRSHSPVTKTSASRLETSAETKSEIHFQPIELLRHYHITGKRVLDEAERLVFEHVSYPKNTRTNFKVTRNIELEPEFYTLHSIHYFMENVRWEHSQYIRRAFTDNVPAIRKPDRDNLIAYMTGEREHVVNLTKATHRELNPHLFESSPDRIPDPEYGGAHRQKDSGDTNTPRKSRFDQPSARENFESGSRFEAAPTKVDNDSGSRRSKFEQPSERGDAWKHSGHNRSRSPPRRIEAESSRQWPSKSQPITDYDPLNPTESSPPSSPKRTSKSRWDIDERGTKLQANVQQQQRNIWQTQQQSFGEDIDHSMDRLTKHQFIGQSLEQRMNQQSFAQQTERSLGHRVVHQELGHPFDHSSGQRYHQNLDHQPLGPRMDRPMSQRNDHQPFEQQLAQPMQLHIDNQFSVKDRHFDHPIEKLVDHHPAVNIGNPAWAAPNVVQQMESSRDPSFGRRTDQPLEMPNDPWKRPEASSFQPVGSDLGGGFGMPASAIAKAPKVQGFSSFFSTSSENDASFGFNQAPVASAASTWAHQQDQARPLYQSQLQGEDQYQHY